jgi:hypothetical protein
MYFLAYPSIQKIITKRGDIFPLVFVGEYSAAEISKGVEKIAIHAHALCWAFRGNHVV